jgi:hypothetical protein
MSHPSPSTATPGERKAAALARIDASRSRLILALSPDVGDHDSAPAPTSGAADSEGIPTASFAARMQRLGVGLGLFSAGKTLARRWWRRQPWHAPVELVASSVAHQINPLVRRHPWAALAAGAAVGAALVALRPWAMGAVKTRWAPWRANLGGLLWSQLGQAPVQMAMAGALAAWVSDLGQQAQRAQAGEAGPAPPGDTPDPPPTH